ncbi:MAG: HAD family hydrolase [Bacteroidales bacterium]|nr:HAD family hydrolase [Bacteroidales bacterium]MDE6236406.1 HAD family hydrolase [Muribaculaceae bacterium]MDE6537001.1 HAD family hydrolase [Muribaculaceae bacterium]
MKKLVIFDLDGTLLNTISDLGNACNYALRMMGYSEHALSTYNYMVGNGVRKLVERAVPDADEETIDKLLSIFREYYDEHCTDSTLPYPGIPELLKELTEKGVAIGVTSNKYEPAVKKIVTHFFPDIPFVALLGQVEERPPKPDPSIIFALLNESPCAKKNILYVGDSAVDMETARRACVTSAGVTWGFRPVSELRRAYAEHIVNKPSEILRLVDEL